MTELLSSVALPVPLPAARTANAWKAFIGRAASAFRTAGGSGTTDQPVLTAPPSPSFEEAAAGRAALTVYEASQDLARRPWAAPTEDWASGVEQMAANPNRSVLLAALESTGPDDTASSAYGHNLTTTSPTVLDVDLAAGVITVTDRLAGRRAMVDAEARLVTEDTTNPDQTC